MGSCIKFFIFRPYGFDYLGFLTNARRGAMRSKTQWVIYRDLDWWPGPQKVQFGEITGYPEVVGLFLALLSSKKRKYVIMKARISRSLIQGIRIRTVPWPRASTKYHSTNFAKMIKPHGMCYSHLGNGERNGAISIMQRMLVVAIR